jgi:hypothetical protein
MQPVPLSTEFRIHVLAKQGDWKGVFDLVYEENVNYQHIPNQTFTIAHHAAWWGADKEVFELLSWLKADFTMMSAGQKTPLTIAQEREHASTQRILVTLMIPGYEPDRSKEELKKLVQEKKDIFWLCKGVTALEAAAPEKLKEFRDKEFQTFAFKFPGFVILEISCLLF